jgi:N-acetylglutamate synthase-like GNAT family acetyltransferase
MDEQIHIRPINREDIQWIQAELQRWWGSHYVVIRKTKYDLSELDGFIATHNVSKVGLIITRVEGTVCEIMSLTTSGTLPKTGLDLIKEVIGYARENGMSRIIVVTTNDNTSALRYYQKMGFNLYALRCNILEESRKIKPEIPLVGNHNIPIRDEIELEMIL